MGRITTDIGVDRAHTAKGRVCACCGENVQRGEKYLHINRNNHLFNLCGKCTVIIMLCLTKGELVLPAKLHKNKKTLVELVTAFRCSACEWADVGRYAVSITLKSAKVFCIICAECLQPHAEQMLKENPMVKADVTAELI